MDRPVIGISTNLMTIAEGPFTNLQRLAVNRGYTDSIEKAGGIPLLLPILSDRKAVDQMLGIVDALLFTGGQDVHPSYYSEEPHALLGETAKERDEHEIYLMQKVHSKNKPILAICRGLQLLNVAFGGTLYQDISQCSGSKPIHSQESEPHAGTHHVSLMPDTKLHTIFGKLSICINSFHHQAIRHLAPTFAVSATSEDGLIEGISKEDAHWVVGVQWHPETMTEAQPEMRKLFEAFVLAASARRTKA